MYAKTISKSTKTRLHQRRNPPKICSHISKNSVNFSLKFPFKCIIMKKQERYFSATQTLTRVVKNEPRYNNAVRSPVTAGTRALQKERGRYFVTRCVPFCPSLGFSNSGLNGCNLEENSFADNFFVCFCRFRGHGSICIVSQIKFEYAGSSCSSKLRIVACSGLQYNGLFLYNIYSALVFKKYSFSKLFSKKILIFLKFYIIF